MSEAASVRGVVLGHGALAEGMVDAVRRITGAEEEVLVPLSNRGKAPDVLLAEIAALVGDAPAILFTDMQGGSCAVAARRLSQAESRVVVVSGVNLPALLEFVLHRELPLAELVPRLLQRGRASIGCAPVELERA